MRMRGREEEGPILVSASTVETILYTVIFFLRHRRFNRAILKLTRVRLDVSNKCFAENSVIVE